MRSINTKIDGDTLPAAAFNSDQDELENAVLSSDQTLDPDAGPDTDLNMLAKAMAGYANAGNVYQDSGAADAYVLSLTTNLKSVTKYYDNMMIVFKAGNSNTGASTVNVETLGVKSITLADGTALGADDIVGGEHVIVIYNLSNDRFELFISTITNSIKDQGGGGNLKTKVIDIDDWDMIANSSVTVAHGLGASYINIRSISGIIRSDDGTALYGISAGRNTANDIACYVDNILATNITLQRDTGGFFDSVNFDSTSFNRGWVTIVYAV